MNIVTDLQFMRQPCRDTTWEEVNNLRLYENLMLSLDSGYRQGVGLAANQIGFNVKFAMYLPERVDEKNSTKWPVFMLNPVIEDAGGLLPFTREGCLSIPHRHYSTWRYSRIEYSSIELDGTRTRKKVEGYEAVVVAHEIEHLYGILCLDRVKKPADQAPNEPCYCASGKKFKKCHGRAVAI